MCPTFQPIMHNKTTESFTGRDSLRFSSISQFFRCHLLHFDCIAYKFETKQTTPSGFQGAIECHTYLHRFKLLRQAQAKYVNLGQWFNTRVSKLPPAKTFHPAAKTFCEYWKNNIFTKNLYIWYIATYLETYIRYLALELLCKSLCGLWTKKFGYPWSNKKASRNDRDYPLSSLYWYHSIWIRCRCSGVIVAVVNLSNNFILTAGLTFM